MRIMFRPLSDTVSSLFNVAADVLRQLLTDQRCSRCVRIRVTPAS